MTYQTLEHQSFSGGINLRHQPDQLAPAQALDLLNVVFSDQHGVASRPGTQRVARLRERARNLMIFGRTTGPGQYIVSEVSGVEILGADGVAVANLNTFPGPHDFTRFGTPTQETVYMASATRAPLRTWDGAAFGVSNSPAGLYCALTPWDNRLIVANIDSNFQGQSRSSVRFSKEGDPTVWDPKFFEDLLPGDGEEIMGVVPWRNYVLAFKRTRFFRFYGTTVASDGSPTFEYQPIYTGVGLAVPRAYAMGVEGVYFLGPDGIYLTNGGEPVKVSADLDPLFSGRPMPFYSGKPIVTDRTSVRMRVVDRRLYVAVPTTVAGTNDRTLVLDLDTRAWTIWDLAPDGIASLIGEVGVAFAVGTVLQKMKETLTFDDDDQPIRSYAHYAWTDLGQPVMKTVREMEVWGWGAVLWGLAKDFGRSRNHQALDFGTGTDTWGKGVGPPAQDRPFLDQPFSFSFDTFSAAPYVDPDPDTWGPNALGDPEHPDLWGSGLRARPRLFRRSVRGTVFSFDVADLNGGPWSISRAGYHMRHTRIPSVIHADR